MPSKKYADTDLFLALLKDSDWLKEKAKKIYEENKDSIYVSPFTVAELMVVCIREDVPLRETIFQISRIAGFTYIRWEVFFNAVEYIEEGASIFNSLLMALVKRSEINFLGENKIISSDKIYKKFDFNVTDLRK
jgi:predicted nucleic acid-binding protein